MQNIFMKKHYLCCMKRIILTFLTVLSFSTMSFAQKSYHGDGPDDILRLIPIGTVVAMKIGGVEGRSDWQHLLVNAGLSTVMTAGLTYSLKEMVHRQRPDGTDNHSFPSGHAAIAFSGAQVLYKEYHQKTPWVCVAGYAVATAVSLDRIRRNRHHWEDVAAGAAIGILSTEFSYWLGDKLFPQHPERYQLSLSPQCLSVQLQL
jgi:membrane-associated phospholipid phosphatase